MHKMVVSVTKREEQRGSGEWNGGMQRVNSTLQKCKQPIHFFFSFNFCNLKKTLNIIKNLLNIVSQGTTILH